MFTHQKQKTNILDSNMLKTFLKLTRHLFPPALENIVITLTSQMFATECEKECKKPTFNAKAKLHLIFSAWWPIQPRQPHAHPAGHRRTTTFRPHPLRWWWPTTAALSTYLWVDQQCWLCRLLSARFVLSAYAGYAVLLLAHLPGSRSNHPSH